jgi:hypothetical protein
MNVQDPDAGLSLPDLLSTATSLFERVHGPLLLGSPGPQGLSVRYVRHKPGRGLVVIYDVYAGGAGGRPSVSSRARPGRHTRAMSLTLDEQALDGTHIRVSARQVHQAPVEVQPPDAPRLAAAPPPGEAVAGSWGLCSRSGLLTSVCTMGGTLDG